MVSSFQHTLSSWLKWSSSMRQRSIARADGAFSATAVFLPLCGKRCVSFPQLSVHSWTRPLLVRKFLQNVSSTGPLSCLKTLTRNFVLVILENHRYFSRRQNVIVVARSDWILTYWKLQFSSTNLKIFESQKLLGECCWELQKLFQRTAN